MNNHNCISILILYIKLNIKLHIILIIKYYLSHSYSRDYDIYRHICLQYNVYIFLVTLSIYILYLYCPDLTTVTLI